MWAVIHTDLKDFENIIIEQKQELIDSFIEDNKYLDFVVQALEALNADS